MIATMLVAVIVTATTCVCPGQVGRGFVVLRHCGLFAATAKCNTNGDQNNDRPHPARTRQLPANWAARLLLFHRFFSEGCDACGPEVGRAFTSPPSHSRDGCAVARSSSTRASAALSSAAM